MLGAEVTMVSNAGHSADLSGPVMTRALCHFDNAYWLPHVAMHGYSGRPTRRATPPSAASAGRRARSPSSILDDIVARRWAGPAGGAPRQLLRHDERNVTPYGQVVDDNILQPLVAELVPQQRLPRSAAPPSRASMPQPGAEEGPGADAGEVRHLASTSCTSTRPARWCMCTPTARCW
jgi:xanthine dehydrogenase large subunit